MNSAVISDIAKTQDVIAQYTNPNEQVLGTGLGGSESLTLFLKQGDNPDMFVRKILSEKLISARWDREGKDVMLPPFKKAKHQALYLQSLPDAAKPYFPFVDNIIERTVYADQQGSASQHPQEYKELIYDMSYIEGIEVSEFIRKHSPAPEVVAKLYSENFSLLGKYVHSERVRKPTTPTLEQSYFSKIEMRLNLARETSPNVFADDLLESEYIYIDGVKNLNIHPLLQSFRESEKFRSVLEPAYHSLVMGDTNTENIKITKEIALLEYIEQGDLSFSAADIGIKFLDPRAIGFHENGEDTGSDDPMYDNKPWHNSIGNYDVLHSEYFDLNVRKNLDGLSVEVIPFEDNPYAGPYRDIEKYFNSVMSTSWRCSDNGKDPHWIIRFAFVMGTHFTAMPPFHFHKNDDGSFSDDYQNQKRPVAIYAEGIRWLNLALKMLKGQVTSFYDVLVSTKTVRKQDATVKL